MFLSIIIPIYNEEENVPKILGELKLALKELEKDYEIIAINDGSSDKSWEELKRATGSYPELKIINFQVNFGQALALRAGFENAKGDIIIPIDADLQNDPKDIPLLIDELNKGYDVVSGWRKDRKDTYLNRVLPSKIANWIISKVTGISLNDYGCTLKAYRRELVKDIKLYGEMHRFIPVYCAQKGAKIQEVVVNHRPRIYGKTKYGIVRTYKVILDLLVLRFLFKYMHRPMHFFGGIGFISLSLGFVFVLWAVLSFADSETNIILTLFIVASLLITIGVMLIAMGILAEMIMRVYFESRNKNPYTIKKDNYGE